MAISPHCQELLQSHVQHSDFKKEAEINYDFVKKKSLNPSSLMASPSKMAWNETHSSERNISFQTAAE